VSSGTQGNLISVLTHCKERGALLAFKSSAGLLANCHLPDTGSEAILGHLSHIHLFEQGGISQLGGVHARTAHNQPDGTIDLKVRACGLCVLILPPTISLLLVVPAVSGDRVAHSRERCAQLDRASA
jgi:threonine aldolase